MGIAVAVVGLFGLVGGSVVAFGARVASSIDPIAEADIPGTLTFESEGGEYEILVVGRRRRSAPEARQVVCDVTLADGSTVTIDGDDRSTVVRIGESESVGTFDAPAGRTAVTCAMTDEPRGRFIVDRPSSVTTVALWVIGVSVAAMLAGAGLILLGALRPAKRT